MKKTKPVWYVAMACIYDECRRRKSLKPITWLFKDMFYLTPAEGVDYYMGTMPKYVKYCRRNHYAMNFGDVW